MSHAVVLAEVIMGIDTEVMTSPEIALDIIAGLHRRGFVIVFDPAMAALDTPPASA